MADRRAFAGRKGPGLHYSRQIGDTVPEASASSWLTLSFMAVFAVPDKHIVCQLAASRAYCMIIRMR